MIGLARIEHRLRPTLAKLLPPSTFMKIYSSGRSDFIKRLAQLQVEPIAGDFKLTELCGLRFRNDLGNAAGLDKDGSLLDFNYNLGAGFAVVGTVLDKPHTGNLFPAFGKEQNPWTPLPNSHSALNSLGLPSLGVSVAVDNIKAFQDRVQPKDFPIGVSIMGHPAQEGEEKLQGVLDCVKQSLPVADFIEINESCPNVKGHDSSAMYKRIQNVMDVAGDSLPIFIKLGNLDHAEEVLAKFASMKVAGVVLLNTQRDYDFYRPKLDKSDHKIFDYYTKEFSGGLSGTIIRQTALDAVKQAKAIIDQGNLDLKLIHVGGIGTNADVCESRNYAQLREWYSLFMERLFELPADEIYKQLTS
ncbi:hypothetical protein PQO03_08305 [Lentisphaera profundi]|uniref:Dihydroorotate dehydrogenase catalytic domain-containing protein n=1 Tax=Lentisphaera profundi TaxID=1658616 RepID=A0ABY7VPH6_9BACT|nr:hypothetical protein [Lentisphaera profundi]WDE95716.1 hypothetical protein PQO03_08305 [Lentisphaera profundi]